VPHSHSAFLSDAQLQAEFSRCENCAEKPCREACPADCSPADFITAARVGLPSDFKRAATLILGHNPLGGICGAVCPDYHCVKACSRRTFDHPVNIPAVQATIIQKAKDLGVMPSLDGPQANGRRVAVVGGGPAGLAAAALLAQKGFTAEVFERDDKPGGMCNLIPDHRLDKQVLRSDIAWLQAQTGARIHFSSPVETPSALLEQGFEAVVVATGLDAPYELGIPGEDRALDWIAFLTHPGDFKGKRVAVIGGGAVAVDCAAEARRSGAVVEMFCLETLAEMPLTGAERAELLEQGIAVTGRTRCIEILAAGGPVVGLKTTRVTLPEGRRFQPRDVVDETAAGICTLPCDVVVVAIGAGGAVAMKEVEGVFYAGDLANGPTTVVEAAAAGKNAALAVEAFLLRRPAPVVDRPTKSRTALPGRVLKPVSLETDFFGRKLRSPFLLSAAPPTDGYEQMKRAYEAGWAGGVMKTCFDGVPVHIPAEYMFQVTRDTYANCDNVSDHPMSRVCEEVRRLVKEHPDRLTMASTGGPVTGDDAHDRAGWQANTLKLESCGVMGIEYSLSCPQGGDGTRGDIVSQDAELTAKIVDWVMAVSDSGIPKLFKLTAAVTAIHPIMAAIQEVFARYPNKKAGVTLANSFPSMAFRQGAKRAWEEGIVVGLSGQGVTQISNLTLANVSRMGMHISGNGGPMNYKAAADFLALGVETVQFCTIVMKEGYGIIDDLEAGLSHLMEARGIGSVGELVGCALPGPITGFMDLSALKKVSAVVAELCEHCGNCTRCPYLAITLGEDKVPVTDASRCIGCSICALKCFSGALYMRTRTPAELALA
jgi:NADPH-dependent glutamate synthase beta subunit-like oxidoreductase/dihydroorotate dehydrogenase/Pyruvate/2-oxoacid:ferredoxin oxidoreductase delta subunit